MRGVPRARSEVRPGTYTVRYGNTGALDTCLCRHHHTRAGRRIPTSTWPASEAGPGPVLPRCDQTGRDLIPWPGRTVPYMQVRGGKAATDTVDARATRRYDLALAGRQTDTPALARRVTYSVT